MKISITQSSLQDASLDIVVAISKANLNKIKIKNANSIISVIDGKHYNISVDVVNDKEGIIKIGPKWQ